jgi:hypothetical protein
MEINKIKVNLLTEKWVIRKFMGGIMDGKEQPEPVAKTKATFYAYGSQEVDGHLVDVLEYVYRLQDETFVNTEINGIIRKYH